MLFLKVSIICQEWSLSNKNGYFLNNEHFFFKFKIETLQYGHQNPEEKL